MPVLWVLPGHGRLIPEKLVPQLSNLLPACITSAVVGVIEFIELYILPLDVLMFGDIAPPHVAASLCPDCQREIIGMVRKLRSC
jgi:hypothetical protein